MNEKEGGSVFQVSEQPPQENENWIPWGVAAEIFRQAGSSNSTFTRSRTRIRKKDTDKKRNVLYLEKDVRAEAQRKARKLPALDIQPATFHQATAADMPELATVIEAIFGGTVNVERWQERIQKNPESGFLLREGTSGEGPIVGCEFIYPHEESHVRQILAALSLVSQPDDILTYEAGQHVNLYLRTVGIIPGVSIKQKRHWAAILVRNCMRFIEDLGRRGVIIDHIWSRSETRDGINILRHMGFTQIESVTNYRNFVIAVPLSGLPMMIRYKKAYQEWQQKTSGEVG